MKTRIKRLARRTICFSKSTLLHDKGNWIVHQPLSVWSGSLTISTGLEHYLRLPDPQWITAWTDAWKGFDEIPNKEYFVYGEEQDCVTLRTKYLKTALAISEGIDSAIYLLNPQVVTEAGEWEAWFFSNELPGANRYRSFREMMQAEKTRVLDNLRDTLEFRATCRK